MSEARLLPVWSCEVGAAEMIPWVEALRDANPIHRDPAVAAALGFGARTVNPGPTNLAYVLNMIDAARPDDHPTHVAARFLGNVFSGDRVEVVGTQDADGAIAARLLVPGRDETALEVSATVGPRR